MEIEIIGFGQISEFIKHQKLLLDNVHHAEELKKYLEQVFPKLKFLKYKLALNKKMVQGNPEIHHLDEVAIMPPFSGG